MNMPDLLGHVPKSIRGYLAMTVIGALIILGGVYTWVEQAEHDQDVRHGTEQIAQVQTDLKDYIDDTRADRERNTVIGLKKDIARLRDKIAEGEGTENDRFLLSDCIIELCELRPADRECT